MTLFLPRLDIEQVEEKTLFFLAEEPTTDGSLLDLIAKYFLTLDTLIEKIKRHPHVEQNTLNYIRLFGAASNTEETINTEKSQQERLIAISQLKVSEKIRLALRGNRDARILLLRDPNREVVLSVMKSPKLTDEEVEVIAQSKAMMEEVLRVIARNSAWTKRYSIIDALVNNPKTPLTVSLGFLKNLRGNDLDHVSKNKGISSVLRNTAMKMIQVRKSGRV